MLSLLMVGSGVLYVIGSLPLSWQVQMLLSFLVLLSVAYALLLRGLLSLPWSVNKLEITDQHGLMLTFQNGTQAFAQKVLADTVVMPFLVVIRLEMTSSSKLRQLWPTSIIIMSDMLDAESFRRLRVWLRWGAPHAFKAIELDAGA